MTVPSLVTIVICSYNRAYWLEKCLMSLQSQMDGVDDIDVLVVDNNSDDDTKARVVSLMSLLPRLRYVNERKQGSSPARTRGLMEVGSPWVAMLDDDGCVKTGYVERLRRHVLEGSYDCIGGVYEAWYPEGRVSWFRDAFATNVGLSDHFGELPPDRFASSGIMLLRRSAAIAAGSFLPVIGMHGTALGYGEETLLQVRMRERGARIGFDPAWRIQHRVSPDKQTIAWQLRSSWAIGRDSWTAFARRPNAGSLLRLVWRLLARPVRGLGREIACRGEQRSWQAWLLAAAKPLAMTVGELAQGMRLYLRGGTRR